MTAARKVKELSIVTSERQRAAKILVVDDDQRNLLALTEVLSPLAQVVTVSSGRDALRALMDDDFAVILLDVFMPDMDGYETAGLIREREQTARIPIIFLSAVNKETEHLMRGYAMGAVDYVFKPVDALVLRSKTAVFVDLYLLRQELADHHRAERELHDAKLRAEQQRLEIERELQAARLRQAAILKSLPVVLFEASYSDDEGLRRRVVGTDEISSDDGATIHPGIGEPGWEDHIASDDREIIAREYSSKTHDGDQTSVRYRWALDSASPRYFLEQAVRVGGEMWVGSITDVTAQSVLESQLLQAQKLDALGQLTGGVAHDFNNLLAAILGGLELLGRRVELNEQGQQIVAQMRQAADQGVTLVKSLLSFARKQPLLPLAIDPDELKATVLPLAEHALGESYTIEWSADCGDCRFYADPSQLTLAVLNLMINARDAMADGGVVVVEVGLPGTHTEPRDEPPAMLRIAIRDSGPGIPPEIASKLTEPFFTTKPPGKGTGLGLSMVAGFIKQSGGELTFTAPADGGTCVEILLPTASPCSPSRGDEEGVENHHDRAPGTGEQRAVLLVDDDDIVRTILGSLLDDLGVQVTSAADGQAALEILRKRKAAFDLVLSDISMPRMSGIELVSQMGREAIDVPIVLMTGNPGPELADQLPAECQILTKPLARKNLTDILDCLATRGGGSRLSGAEAN